MGSHIYLAKVKIVENRDCKPSKITPDKIKSTSKAMQSRTEISVNPIMEDRVWLKISLHFRSAVSEYTMSWKSYEKR